MSTNPNHVAQERFNEMKRIFTLSNAVSNEGYLLSPAETKKIYPLLKVDDIYGSFYSPGCGVYLKLFRIILLYDDVQLHTHKWLLSII